MAEDKKENHNLNVDHDNRDKINKQILKYNVLMDIRQREKMLSMHYTPTNHEIKADLRILFEDCRGGMARTKTPEQIGQLEKDVSSNDYEPLLRAFREICSWLDENGITTIVKNPVIY